MIESLLIAVIVIALTLLFLRSELWLIIQWKMGVIGMMWMNRSLKRKKRIIGLANAVEAGDEDVFKLGERQRLILLMMLWEPALGMRKAYARATAMAQDNPNESFQLRLDKDDCITADNYCTQEDL